ncbi:chemotaxis protein CheD [Haliovirga abyssi]|uniref:Probable chemoreceptor glutamine deamidase CheD n=1 Tax=Haliovirga abyssi TaxID=2996794 RepID=A0AAU9E180_9FUSO|nr:chemotaxis protein CheD [Haliovirga abyssi]BDU50130.1 putative chemoreceptor glutamine deamidase CheD [Haliovirga abyssi]
MTDTIKVGMADYKVGENPSKIITLGLGSCVGITIYDKGKKIGGMAHIMLPKNTNPEKRSLKFADVAIEEMIEELLKKGSRLSGLEAKIAGGSQMFAFSSSDEKKSIGYRNAVAVKQILKELKINLIAEDTGGKFGRTIELDLSTGELKIKTIGHGEKYI